MWRSALCGSDLDQTARLVAHTISVFMNGSATAFPAKETIADAAGIRSVRAVDRAILRLEAAGYLEVRRSSGGRANTYVGIAPDGAVRRPRRKKVSALEDPLAASLAAVGDGLEIYDRPVRA